MLILNSAIENANENDDVLFKMFVLYQIVNGFSLSLDKNTVGSTKFLPDLIPDEYLESTPGAFYYVSK